MSPPHVGDRAVHHAGVVVEDAQLRRSCARASRDRRRRRRRVTPASTSSPGPIAPTTRPSTRDASPRGRAARSALISYLTTLRSTSTTPSALERSRVVIVSRIAGGRHVGPARDACGCRRRSSCRAGRGAPAPRLRCIPGCDELALRRHRRPARRGLASFAPSWTCRSAALGARRRLLAWRRRAPARRRAAITETVGGSAVEIAQLPARRAGRVLVDGTPRRRRTCALVAWSRARAQRARLRPHGNGLRKPRPSTR